MARTPFFFWYELMTTDIDAARDFYAGVIGWRPESWPGTDMSGKPYIVMNAADRGVAGIMNQPDTVRSMGAPPAWIGYIYAADVDAATDAVKAAGGSVFCPPMDIPNVGRFSVVTDPQGASFQFLQPDGPDQPAVAPGTSGHVGWHELLTPDLEAGFAFYSSQFGWIRDEALDMGEMGPYQLFRIEPDGDSVGAMMKKPPHIPVPVWQFTFNIPDVDVAVTAVRDGGGKVAMEPMEVPGGQWFALCQDPQGAFFGVVAPGRNQP